MFGEFAIIQFGKIWDFPPKLQGDFLAFMGIWLDTSFCASHQLWEFYLHLFIQELMLEEMKFLFFNMLGTISLLKSSSKNKLAREISSDSWARKSIKKTTTLFRISDIEQLFFYFAFLMLAINHVVLIFTAVIVFTHGALDWFSPWAWWIYKMTISTVILGIDLIVTTAKDMEMA